jgi:hypothetical protein
MFRKMPKFADKDIVMEIQRSACSLLVALLFACNVSATSVPSLTFEELTDRSELIVSGQVTRSWADWDSEHKFIWTHYELSVSNAQKGTPGLTVELAEPGGVVGIQGMAIAGAVVYQPGDHVLVFLQRMPNGYLRTTGWSQGKYTVDNTGRLHAETSLRGLDVVSAQKGAAAATPVRTLDGMTVAELRSRISARLQEKGGAR